MRIKLAYLIIKEKVKDFFGIKSPLNKEQTDYVLSGINKDLLNEYKIIYSPEYLFFRRDEKGTKIENPLEKKLIDYIPKVSKQNLDKKEYLSYLIGLKLKIKDIHQKNMETIRLNHLKTMNKIYSSVVETYNKGMNVLRNILIENRADKGIKISFI